MKEKATVESIKKLIREVQMEQAYQERFVENFSDVREPVLTESEMQSLEELLYNEVFKNKP